VVKLIDLEDAPHIERELMMIKVKTTDKNRDEIKHTAEIFRGKIIDVTASTYVIEMTGASDKLDAFLSVINDDVIIEVVRSGATGISRGEKGLHL
jgi:acetolactate synthase-1/3 small subunit